MFCRIILPSHPSVPSMQCRDEEVIGDAVEVLWLVHGENPQKIRFRNLRRALVNTFLLHGGRGGFWPTATQTPHVPLREECSRLLEELREGSRMLGVRYRMLGHCSKVFEEWLRISGAWAQDVGYRAVHEMLRVDTEVEAFVSAVGEIHPANDREDGRDSRQAINLQSNSGKWQQAHSPYDVSSKRCSREKLGQV